MNNKHNKQKLFLRSLLGAVLLTLNLTIVQSQILGIFGFLLFFIPLALWLAVLLHEHNEGKIFWGALLLLSSMMLLTAFFYYIYGITPLISIIILIALLSSFLLKPSKIQNPFKIDTEEKIKFSKKEFYLLILFSLSEIILLGSLIINRSTELMPSPWSAVGPWFFIIYFLSTGLLFYLVYNSKSEKTQLILSTLHLFTTFAVTTILYPLGYGFDAFVHRASEMWIFNNGYVSPKQPYYVGQYSFVVWLAQLTKIPLFYIDIYLVPLLASSALPAGIIYSLKRAWDMPSKYSSLFVWIIPFVPFLSLHLTTPHNIVLLFSILLVFITLAHLKGSLSFTIPLLLSLAAVSTHPLVGAPMFVFTITAIIVKKYKKIFFAALSLSFFTTVFSLPLMFIANNWRSGAGLPEFSNPLLGLNKFFELFARPYWYAKDAPIVFELLYAWQRLIAPFVITLGIIGLCILLKKKGLKPYLLYIITPIGFVISAWLLRSWVTFPDVVSYEQGDFPLRLVKASILFVLPFTIYYLLFTLQKIEKLKNRKAYLGLILISASTLIMLSFYLSYPQRNPKARFPGLNVTASDFEAVDWIHNRHKEYNYIVLSNQLVSAAALTNYSFVKYFDTPNGEIFYYSVPTGGLLYRQYGKMLYEGQKQEYMSDAMDLANVDTSYFVLNSYWANADKIIEGAKKTADSWHTIDGGKVWIFLYKR